MQTVSSTADLRTHSDDMKCVWSDVHKPVVNVTWVASSSSFRTLSISLLHAAGKRVLPTSQRLGSSYLGSSLRSNFLKALLSAADNGNRSFTIHSINS